MPLSCASRTCATATCRRTPRCTVRHLFRPNRPLHASLMCTCHRVSCRRDSCHDCLRWRPHCHCRHAAPRLGLRRLRRVGGRHAPAALRSSMAPAKCQFCSERRVCCVWVRPLRATAVHRCLVRVGLQQPGAARRQRPPPPFFPHA